jgi:hypothetical protein
VKIATSQHIITKYLSITSDIDKKNSWQTYARIFNPD